MLLENNDEVLYFLYARPESPHLLEEITGPWN